MTKFVRRVSKNCHL